MSDNGLKAFDRILETTHQFISVLAITVPIVAGVAFLILLILGIARAKSLITLWQNQKSALSN